VGLILNIRYLEIVNFVPAWFGLDLTGEDGDPRGKWPWQSDYTGNMPERLRLSEPAGEPAAGSQPAAPEIERPLPR